MANEIMPNMGIELPTPGVTGALGVEAPGASWMELQNEGFRKVDAHDHGGAGGAPIDASALSIAADLPFNGFSATDLATAQFIAGGATAPARSIFFYNGDFWISNGTAVPVRLTNGASIAAAAGNITGLSGAAAITWNSGLGVFIFESTSGTKAGIYCGPLSIFEPVAGGKKATISVPAGLAADYALTLPASLPVSTKPLMLSAAGVISASDLTRPLLPAVGQQYISPLTQTVQTVSDTVITGDLVLTGATGRPIMVLLRPNGGGGFKLTADGGAARVANISVYRKIGAGAYTLLTGFSIRGEPSTVTYATELVFLDIPGAGDITYQVRGNVSNVLAQLDFLSLIFQCYEL